MKLKITTVSAACLLVCLLLAAPYFVKGKSEKTDTEVYEIDYRGPETHNSKPPPENFHRRPPYIHHKTSALEPSNSKGSPGVRVGGNS